MHDSGPLNSQVILAGSVWPQETSLLDLFFMQRISGLVCLLINFFKYSILQNWHHVERT